MNAMMTTTHPAPYFESTNSVPSSSVGFLGMGHRLILGMRCWTAARCFIAIVCLFCSWGLPAIRAETITRPNIILIMADDLGYEGLSCNGSTSYRTPRLDRMASEGIRFTHCYSQPLCTPSRVKLMTGISNKRNYERFGFLPPDEVVFPQLLQRAGYATCVVGKWQLAGGVNAPRRAGFDEYCLWQLTHLGNRYWSPELTVNGREEHFGDGVYGPEVVCDFACDFMRRHRDDPFFVYWPMILTHCPFAPTPESDFPPPLDLYLSNYKGDPQYFGDMVATMDRLIGRVVDAVEELGIADRTLILFTGDNGTDKPIISHMGSRRIAGGKGQMTDAGTHVPLVAWWPGKIEPAVRDDLIEFSDFFPTICDVAGVVRPSSLTLDGVSFARQLQGETGPARKGVHVWYSRNGGEKGEEWVRDHRWKLYADGRLIDVPADPLEKNPVDPQALDRTQRSRIMVLREALEQFEDVRPDDVSQAAQRHRERQRKRKK